MKTKDKIYWSIWIIFFCSVLVSFSHTIEWYKSAGFTTPIDFLNRIFNGTIVERWFGENIFTHALFATVSAEVSFSVGLWGLFDAYQKEGKFPKDKRHVFTWLTFLGGLFIVACSNVGSTLGYNYLFGNPHKGWILGLSMPYNILSAILVMLSRTLPEPTNEQTSNNEQKLIGFARTAGTAFSAFRSAIQKTPNNETNNNDETNRVEQIGHKNEPASPNIEHLNKSITLPERIEQYMIERQPANESETSNAEQHEQQTTEHQLTNKHQSEERNEQHVSEANNELSSSETKRKHETNKTKLYVVKNKRTKKDEIIEYVTGLMKENKTFKVTEVANKFNCAKSTASVAIKEAEQKMAQ